MTDAYYVQEGDVIRATLAAAVVVGDIVQMPDGRAGQACDSFAAGVEGEYRVKGIVEVTKTASMVVLIGSKLFWDASANAAHLLHRNDADFYLGMAHKDATSAATTIQVVLNEEPAYTLSLESGFASVPVRTAGVPFAAGFGNGVNLGFSATAEAQKVDALSHRGMAVGTPGILDMLICINDQGDDGALDFNAGLANGTHASDADSITESMFVHLDGNTLDLKLESEDGTTTVAATDTTVNAVAGTPFLVQFDLRNDEDIQVYIDGVNVLPDSVFKLNAAAGPLKLLAHMEKSSNDTPGNVTILDMGVRTFNEAA